MAGDCPLPLSSPERATLCAVRVLLIENPDGTNRSGDWESDADLPYGGGAFISWLPHGDSLTVYISGTKTGRVQPVQEFARQSDGSLVKIEDGFTFRYAKQ